MWELHHYSLSTSQLGWHPPNYQSYALLNLLKLATFNRFKRNEQHIILQLYIHFCLLIQSSSFIFHLQSSSVSWTSLSTLRCNFSKASLSSSSKVWSPMRPSSQSFKHVKTSSIFAIRVVLLSPIIFASIEKEDSDATVDIGGISRSHVILDSTWKVD